VPIFSWNNAERISQEEKRFDFSFREAINCANILLECLDAFYTDTFSCCLFDVIFRA